VKNVESSIDKSLDQYESVPFLLISYSQLKQTNASFPKLS